MPDDTPIPEPSADLHPAAEQRGLVLVSTPIGNLGDITQRAVAVLRSADLVLCEDTRVSGKLMSLLGVRARLTPLHDHNEDARIPDVLAMLRDGRLVVLVSDAGTPLVSDPGYRLVRAAVAEGLPVSGVPGANAALLALVLSGLPPHPYLFLGFPPPRSAARQAAFARLRAAERAGLAVTLIWYEAPHRVAGMLADLHAIFGDRPAAIARELTKRFEEVRRGPLASLAAAYADAPPRGEIVVVLGPAPPETAGEEDIDLQLRAALQALRLKEAVGLVAERTGAPRGQVYARALALKGEREG